MNIIKRLMSSRIVNTVNKVKWFVLGLIIGHIAHNAAINLIGAKTYYTFTSGNNLKLLIGVVLIIAFLVFDFKTLRKSRKKSGLKTIPDEI